MIFVTTGTQAPFDRLIMTVDSMAHMLPGVEIIAQTTRTSYQVRNMSSYNFLPPSEFNSLFKRAELIVSHAGMGTIISALVQEKPILVMPRLAKNGEHRNDHQLATARALDKLKYVHAAYTAEELEFKILELAKCEQKRMHKIGDSASVELITSLRTFINS